jgi:hypothetical protein
MAIPISIKPVEVHINADKRLVFQYLTAFGMPGPDGARTSNVLIEEDGRRLVEFFSSVKMLGRIRRVRTVEWVTEEEPNAISFDGVKGPLPLLRDRLELDDHGGSCTVLHYHSTIGVRGGILGWPVGVLYAKPLVERHMLEHLVELKEVIETRARRNHAYPHQTCTHDAPAGPVPVEVAVA